MKIAIQWVAGRRLLALPSVLRPQVANLTSVEMRPKDFKRPPAFPYKDKPYGMLQSIFDVTTSRLDENSKVCTVTVNESLKEHTLTLFDARQSLLK